MSKKLKRFRVLIKLRKKSKNLAKSFSLNLGRSDTKRSSRMSETCDSRITREEFNLV